MSAVQSHRALNAAASKVPTLAPPPVAAHPVATPSATASRAEFSRLLARNQQASAAQRLAPPEARPAAPPSPATASARAGDTPAAHDASAKTSAAGEPASVSDTAAGESARSSEPREAASLPPGDASDPGADDHSASDADDEAAAATSASELAALLALSTPPLPPTPTAAVALPAAPDPGGPAQRASAAARLTASRTAGPELTGAGATANGVDGAPTNPNALPLDALASGQPGDGESSASADAQRTPFGAALALESVVADADGGLPDAALADLAALAAAATTAEEAAAPALTLNGTASGTATPIGGYTSTTLARAADGIASTPVAASIATPLGDPGFHDALGLQVSVLARGGVQHAELRLNPAELGPVSVQITMQGDHARVDFGADLVKTRQVIEAGWAELAASLQDAGFTLSGGGVSEHARQRQGAADGRSASADAAAAGAAAPDEAPAAVVLAARPRAGAALDLYA